MRMTMVAAAVAACFAAPAMAGITVITDRAQFQALGTFGATTTFDARKAGDVLTSGFSLFNVDGGGISSVFGLSVAAAGDRLVATGGAWPTRFLASKPGADLLGFTLGTTINAAKPGFIRIFTAEDFKLIELPESKAGASSFVGIQLTGGDSLNAVTVTGPYGVTDIQIGTASVVPEPATWALMIAGFGLVGASVRRRGRIARVAA